MIITVTFNPAIDKTAEVEELVPGTLHRLANVRSDAAGKGINVSKTLKNLGKDTVAVGFLAGTTGQFIRDALNDLGIENHFVEVEGQTRTNLKVLNKDMELTELNEAGPVVTAADIEKMLETIRSVKDDNTYVVLSGNTGPGLSKDIYKQMIEALHEMGIEVILDADGELFANGIQAGPICVKPNAFELAQYFHTEESRDLNVIANQARQLLNDKTRLVVVSMGSRGSLFVTKDAVYFADALKIPFQSSVGAGDAMVSGLAKGIEEGLPLEEVMDLAVALSAGACMTQGTQPADRDTVEELKKQVVKTRL